LEVLPYCRYRTERPILYGARPKKSMDLGDCRRMPYLRKIISSTPFKRRGAAADVGVSGMVATQGQRNAQDEFNVAPEPVDAISGELRQALIDTSSRSWFHADQIRFATYIFRPRSDLLCPAEYRRLAHMKLLDRRTAAGQFDSRSVFVLGAYERWTKLVIALVDCGDDLVRFRRPAATRVMQELPLA